MRFPSLALSAALLLAGCGGEALSLTATATSDVSDDPGFAPSAPDARLLRVDLRLENRSGRTLPLSASLFRLDPVEGASVTGASISASLERSCVPAGGVLPPGRDLECGVAFEVGAGFEPASITFSVDELSASSPVPPLGGPVPDAGPVDAGPLSPSNELDILFLVDDSSSMSEEQQSLASALPRLISVLSTGDFDQDGLTTGPDDFPPVSSVHAGVITTDMGTGGHSIPTCRRPEFGDDGVLRTEGRFDLSGCAEAYPAFLAYAPPGGLTAGEFARDAACVAQVGTGGCGFEQPLEAVLKALSPAAATAWTRDGYAAPSFHLGSAGHGDGANAGFLREGSALAVVLLTDEEDCSAADPDLFDPTDPEYGETDLNLRCFVHGDEALHPVQRFVDGLVQLRRHPGRLAFVPIVGIPLETAATAGGTPNWERLASEDESARHPALIERIDEAEPYRLVPSCNLPGRGVAFPPIRISRVAQGLDALGAQVTVQSICQEDLTTATEELVIQIRRALGR